MPCAAVAVQGVSDAPVPTVSPGQSGVCGAVSPPTQRGTATVCRPGRASGVGPSGTISLIGGVAGVHDPRVDRRTSPIGLAMSRLRVGPCTNLK